MYRGEDIALKLTTTISGVLQSIDDMPDLIAVLYSQKQKTILGIYSKVAAAGHTTLVRVSATEYTIIVPYTITRDYPLADLLIEVCKFKSDIRFPDGKKRGKGIGIITEVKPSMINE